MTNLTRADIEALVTLEKAATPGDWDTWGEVADLMRNGETLASFVTGLNEAGDDVQTQQDMDNAVFSAALRNAAPALFALALDGLRIRQAEGLLELSIKGQCTHHTYRTTIACCEHHQHDNSCCISACTKCGKLKGDKPTLVEQIRAFLGAKEG